MTEDSRPLIVSIWCLTYNQEKYVRQCLDGFVMQKTNFRFEAIVHDDASTDSTADIVREYAEKYPDIIRPIIETENQYSKKDGSLDRIMIESCTGKYVAMCEGDDYWTDPLKLQKQVDFMESHPDYSMCCSDCVVDSPNGIIDRSRYVEDSDISVEDMVMGGGGYVATCSLLMRPEVIKYAEVCGSGPIGDVPMQIYATLIGKVHYFAEKMVTYRYMAIGSWNERHRGKNKKSMLPNWKFVLRMLDAFDEFSEHKYHQVFQKRKVFTLAQIMRNEKAAWREMRSDYGEQIKLFDNWQHLEDWLTRLGLDRLSASVGLLHTDGVKPALVVLPPFCYLYRLMQK